MPWQVFHLYNIILKSHEMQTHMQQVAELSSLDSRWGLIPNAPHAAQAFFIVPQALTPRPPLQAEAIKPSVKFQQPTKAELPQHLTQLKKQISKIRGGKCNLPFIAWMLRWAQNCLVTGRSSDVSYHEIGANKLQWPPCGKQFIKNSFYALCKMLAAFSALTVSQSAARLTMQQWDKRPSRIYLPNLRSLQRKPSWTTILSLEGIFKKWFFLLLRPSDL